MKGHGLDDDDFPIAGGGEECPAQAPPPDPGGREQRPPQVTQAVAWVDNAAG